MGVNAAGRTRDPVPEMRQPGKPGLRQPENEKFQRNAAAGVQGVRIPVHDGGNVEGRKAEGQLNIDRIT